VSTFQLPKNVQGKKEILRLTKKISSLNKLERTPSEWPCITLKLHDQQTLIVHNPLRLIDGVANDKVSDINSQSNHPVVKAVAALKYRDKLPTKLLESVTEKRNNVPKVVGVYHVFEIWANPLCDVLPQLLQIRQTPRSKLLSDTSALTGDYVAVIEWVAQHFHGAWFGGLTTMPSAKFMPEFLNGIAAKKENVPAV
jgi:hypothetical protein